MRMRPISVTAGAPLFLALMIVPPIAAQNTITVDGSRTHQTIVGWEATAWLGQGGRNDRYRSYRDELLDKAVNELGLTRLRVSVRSGFERPDNGFGLFQKGDLDIRGWGSRRYAPINDNSDPQVADPAGFHWDELNLAIDEIVLPMRKRLAANGERLYVNLLYIDFGRSDFEHGHDPLEYAEFMSVAFTHMQGKYGFAPDAIEVKLEPDKQGDNWTPAHMADAIVAAGDRLAKEGFRPDFIAPSTWRAGAVVHWVGKMIKANPRVTEYLSEICYHRYGNPTEQFLPGILAAAAEHGLRTSMGEWLKADYVILPYQALHNDLAQGHVSSWQQYTLGAPGAKDGRGYFTGDGRNPGRMVLTRSARFLRQYFKYIRPGAVRIDAGSDNKDLSAVSFVNKDGGVTTVVQTAGAAVFSVRGLPVGAYGLVYTTDAESATRLPRVTVGAGGSVRAATPAKGVVTIYAIPGNSLHP